MTIAFIAIIIALALGYFVQRQLRATNRADIERLCKEIESATQRHAPRKHLYRQLIQARCRELQS